jgi:hypothetical protein
MVCVCISSSLDGKNIKFKVEHIKGEDNADYVNTFPRGNDSMLFIFIIKFIIFTLMSENFYETIILPLISGSTENQVFFREKQILKSSQECLYCSVRMNIVICNKIKDKQVWKCQNKESSHFKTALLIRTGSFFNQCKISLGHLLHIFWKFLSMN